VIDGYSHQNLASMAECLRESFTAVIDRFKDREALTTGRRHIEITDRSQLE
jgi:CRP-like cAMP-binding protein